MVPDSLCAQNRLKVRVRGGYLADVEVLHQEVEDVRGEIGRQGRAELDVLDPQVEEREEDDVGLLLVPGKDEGERQIVNPAVEGACQGQGNLDRRVCVVALP